MACASLFLSVKWSSNSTYLIELVLGLSKRRNMLLNRIMILQLRDIGLYCSRYEHGAVIRECEYKNRTRLRAFFSLRYKYLMTDDTFLTYTFNKPY